ncbi:MAG: hypothetical protein WBQ60_07060, partial [Asticcacaulis sp.]
MPELKSHNPYEDVQARTLAQALSELGLSEDDMNGPVDHAAIRKAFRLKIKSANPTLHNGGDRYLRRLIMARDLLIARDAEPFQTAVCDDPACYALGDGATLLTISLEQALSGGMAERVVPALEFACADEALT